ncbi:MAG: hypothetical protein K8Q89_03865 [Nitrosarchaeum sp.]|nr:hypothetical protein [Nitrosarchaeum sp.]
MRIQKTAFCLNYTLKEQIFKTLDSILWQNQQHHMSIMYVPIRPGRRNAEYDELDDTDE